MSELEFRTDDIERAQIRERNIKLAKAIISQEGIRDDNPLYKEILMYTIENVHNAFRFSNYDEAKEEMIASMLRVNKDDLSAYKQASLNFKRSLIENQVRTASGSTFGNDRDISYENLYATIRQTMQSGMEMRKEFGTEFPDIFYDEEGNLRERLVLEIPYDMQESSAMGMIINYARTHEGVYFDREENRIMVNGKPVGPEKFFRNKFDKLEKFIKQVEANSSALDLDDEELMNVVLSGNYTEFTELRAKRGKEGDKRNLALRNALADAQVFEDVQERLVLHEKGNVASFMHYLTEAMLDYDTKANLVRREAEKDTIENIDRIMFTINPYDVATQSTFRDWNSCMHAVGCNHRYVDDAIGMGSIVAYGYDSSNPSKMVSRLLIHPFTNEKGEVAYNVNPRIYGHENMAFRQVVRSFVSSELNKGKNGKFIYNRGRAYDSKGYLYNDGGAGEFLCYAPDERGCVDFRDIEGKEFDFGATDVSVIKKFIFAEGASIKNITLGKDTELEFNDYIALLDVNIAKGVKFNGEGEIRIHNLEKIDEGVAISQPVYLSGHIVDGADLRGFENLTLGALVTFGKGVKLPKNVKVNRCEIVEGNVPRGMDLSKYENVCLKNIHTIEDGVKLPSKIKFDGAIPSGVNLADFESVRVKDLTDIAPDVEFPKEFAIEGSLYGGDFSSVEKLTLINPEVGNYVKFPNDVFITGGVTYATNLSNIENVIYTGEVNFRYDFTEHPKNCKFAEDVVVSGNLFSKFDFSGNDSLEIGALEKVEEGVKFPKKVKINETRGEINYADFTDVEYLEINSGLFEGENVKFAGQVKISNSNIHGCDFSKVDVLEIGERVFMGGETKLPEELTIKGYLPYSLNLSGVKKLIADVDVFNYGEDILPEELIIKGNISDYNKFNGVKKLIAEGAKKIDCDCSKIDFMELSNEDKEFEFGRSMLLPKKLKLPHGSTIKGCLQAKDGVDISNIENLALTDCEVKGGVQLPEDIRVSGKVFYKNDYSSCKSMTLFGNCELGFDVKYPEMLKVADNTTLSGTIPAGLDLSQVKGLVLSGDVRIGEGVKLPKDVKIEKRVYGFIPDRTDLSNIDDLTLGDRYAPTIFGKDVKLPDNCKYEGKPTVEGYIPENIDHSAVKFHEAIFTGHIPDGTNVGYNAKLVGEITLGKNVEFSWNTDCSQAVFLGDCYLSDGAGAGDFSKAQSVVFSSGVTISKDIKFPENGNVTFGDLVLAADAESILMISKYNLDNTVVCMEAIDKGMSLPNNVMFAFVDEDRKCYGVCPKGCEDKMKALLSEQLDTVEYLSYDELHERFGVNIIDVQKEKEKQSAIADIKSRLAQKGVGVKSEGPDDKSSTSTPKVNSPTISINDGISI